MSKRGRRSKPWRSWAALGGLAFAEAFVGVGAVSGCSERRATPPPDAMASSAEDAGSLSRDELLDPKACQSCHPAQFEEWSGSMHAYASEDPVFRAMNARGQEDTGGKLGTFCVNCHAPMAVDAGLTRDGLNLDSLPAAYRGVTCYFCHNVEAVEGDHNNPLRLANDNSMRGPFADPAPNRAHRSAFSPFMDKGDQRSAQSCGACHDVVVDAHALGATGGEASVFLERTFEEWKQTLFNRDVASGGLTCNGCHMPISPRRESSAVGEGLPKRQSRRHDFEGVDLALVPFPNAERQRLLTQQFLDSSLLGEICVSRDGVLAVTLENSAGHHWPSGATFDRLGWLSVQAYDVSGMVFETVDPEADSPLNVPATMTVSGPDAASDPFTSVDAATGPTADAGDVSMVTVVRRSAPTLTETVAKADGSPAHFFWEVAEITGSTSLPGVVTRDPLSPDYHAERRTWQLDTQQSDFDSITEVRLTVRLRPIKLEVLSDLVSSGHLEAEVASRMPVLELLPQRCHTAAEVETHGDILVGAATDCDPTEPTHATTLTWRRDQAVEGNRNFRKIVLEGAPALCLAHPTYIPPPLDL